MNRLPALLLLLLCIEMGLSYQLSAGTLILGLLLLASARLGGFSFTRADLIAFVALVGLMLLSCLGYPGQETWWPQALRVGFQCTLVGASALIIRSFRGHADRLPVRLPGQTTVFAYAVCGTILALALVQLSTILATGGNTIRIPVEWYASDRSEFIQDPRRPSAFYSEPSYAGFVLTSLACINATASRSMPLALMLLAGTVVCQSASGLAAVVLVQAPLFLRLWSPRGVAFGAIACGGILAMLASFPDGQLRLLDRAVEVSSDESIATRLVNPWIAIDHVWQHDPLGVQQKSIDEYAVANHLPIVSVQYQVASGDTVIVTRPAFVDNGMLNMLLYHGLFALPIICLLAYCLQLRSYTHVAYFLLIGQFNGDWLSPDKIGALTLVVILAAAQQPSGPAPTPSGRPEPR